MPVWMCLNVYVPACIGAYNLKKAKKILFVVD